MVDKQKELLSFLDEFTIEKCKEMTPGVTLEQIGDGLTVFSTGEGVSSVFYNNEYIMTIDWKIVQ